MTNSQKALVSACVLVALARTHDADGCVALGKLVARVPLEDNRLYALRLYAGEFVEALNSSGLDAHLSVSRSRLAGAVEEYFHMRMEDALAPPKGAQVSRN